MAKKAIFKMAVATILNFLKISFGHVTVTGGRHHSDTHHSDKCDNRRPTVCILEEPGA